MNYSALDKALAYLNDGVIDESFIINEKDIYYNKKAFDNGDINLCFITGHSGSGKSTMGAKAARHNDIETYSLDDLQCVKDHFTMDNLKEYGDLIYSYFNGPGKKFYLTYDEIIEKKLSGSDYEDKLFPGFVNYAKQYASSHKDKKFIIEGVWLFCDDEHGKPWFRPEEFKDYAFYIKGTSALISKYRAAKRDSKYDNGTNKVNKGFDRFKSFTKDFFTKNWKWYLIDEKRINVFRDYFKKLESVNESKDASELSSNFKKKSDLHFKILNMKSSSANKYVPKEWKDEFNYKTKDAAIAVCKEDDELAGFIYWNSKSGAIGPLKVYSEYRGYGISELLLKTAIDGGGYKLGVYEDNKVAYNLYKKMGFKEVDRKEYADGDVAIMMELDKK